MEVKRKLHVSNETKPLYSLIVFLIVLLCLALYFPANPFEGNGRSWVQRTRYGSEQGKLGNVLRKASMSDRTVILTTLNQAWASPGSIIDLFLESFKVGEGTEALLNNLVILATDNKSCDTCRSIHPHCYSLLTTGIDFSMKKQFTTPNNLSLMWRKIDFLRVVLELGYSFVYTDADVLWLRNPFPHLGAREEITVACNFYMGNPSDNKEANGGFMYVKSNAVSLEFYKYWYMARVLYPKSHAQSVFEIIKHDPLAKSLGLRIKYLDTTYFSGFCQPSSDMGKVCTMHANCCLGTERKLHDLRLVLDDWKNFTSLPQEKKLRSTSLLWKTPSKCKQS